jgi:para-nitrobenzyl esterase
VTVAGVAFGLTVTPASADVRPSPVAMTETGAIRGASNQVPATSLDADAFLGIPYAAPPEGALRWEPPARASSWRGVRDGTVAPPICPQGTTGTEDCLYLNLYRPTRTTRTASLPVMVYAHGGANTSGSANGYDGGRIAAVNGVIVVSFNYRLGALGFLDHPAIAKESPAGQAGNYGLMDSKAALAWVQRNISAFGGDPTKVTLASQSSGATNTCQLLTDRTSKGLYSAAILSSDDCIHDVDTPSEAVARAEDLAKKVGCTESAKAAECLRSKTPAELTAAGGNWNPVASRPASEKIAAGDWNRVPIMLGSTRNEGRSAGTAFTDFTAADYRAWVTRLVGPDNTDAVLKVYPADKYSGAYAIPYVIGDLITDSGMRGLGGCTNVALAKSFASQTRTYYYQFDDPNVPAPSTPAGYAYLASHGYDVAYWFPDSRSNVSSRFTPEQWRLSTELIRYWGEFTKTHRPSGRGQTSWPRLTDTMMTLQPGGSRPSPVRHFMAEHACSFWATMPLILDRGEI